MLIYSDDTETAKQAPQVQFIPVEGRLREEAVKLEWPLQIGERRIEHILVRRMTTAQVEAFIAAAAIDPKASPPMLFFTDDEPVTRDVLDALDPDDDTRVFEVMKSFLPLRLRQVIELVPAFGGDMPPSSQAV